VKEIIQADIQLTLSKIESLEDLNMNQLETNISWSRVATLKHNRSKYRKQEISYPPDLTSNRYSLLNNNVTYEDHLLVTTNSVSGKKQSLNYVKKPKIITWKKKKVLKSADHR